MSKRKQQSAPSQKAAIAPQTKVTFLFSIALGAIAAMLALSFLKFGPQDIWSPFGTVIAKNGVVLAKGTGGNVYRGLAMSAMIGGFACAAGARRNSGPQGAMACALGWALWGLGFHAKAPTAFLNFLPPGATEADGFSVFFANGPSQGLCVAFGLMVASGAAWVVAQGFFREQKRFREEEKRTPTMSVFSNAMTYPLVVAVLGGVFTMVGGILVLPLGQPPAASLPGPVPAALLCAVIVVLAFAAAAFITRRNFKTVGTIGYSMAAPIVIAFISGMYLSTNGQFPLLHPAALLIWNSSAFESACWGSVGSSIGYFLAGRLPAKAPLPSI